MFEKNLHDLVRGIRTNKNNEAKFISACIEEIRNEIKTVSIEFLPWSKELTRRSNNIFEHFE